MGLKIAVMGSAPSSRMLAPFQDLSWEIWACSPPNFDLPRVDAWFELHSLKRKMSKENEPFIKVIQAHARTYLNGNDPLFSRFPNATPFPFEELRKEFGDWFFTSSIAWMMAFAIHCKPEEIGLWGIDMSAVEEYGYQRAGCHYFITEANRRGIKICAPEESDILNHAPLYGLREQCPQWWKERVRQKELKDRIRKAEAIKDNAEREALVLKGAVDAGEYFGNTYCPTRLSNV
jgi:hypothetical protein